MARKGRKDRGLVRKPDTAGKPRWHVRLYHEGKERRFGSFTTKTQARDFYEKAKQEQQAGRFFPERYQRGGSDPAGAYLDRYLATQAGKTAGTMAAERYYAAWWKDRLAGTRLNAITPAVLEEAKRELAARGLASQTVLHYLKFLRHVLYVAIREGRLERNPFARVPLPKVRPTRTRFLSVEEEAALVTALGPGYGLWARLAILTGLRKSEQFGLRWADVDLERGLLTLPRTKSGEVQYLPLNEEARGILRGLDSWQQSGWVFPSKTRTSHLEVHNFYGRVFLPAVKAVGLEGVTWHTLRHTFASRLAMSGQTPSTIAALLRHSGTDLVARYAHLSPSHLRDAVEGVAAYGDRSPAQGGKPEPPLGVGQPGPISNRTVTKTGIDSGADGDRIAEVVESVGRGERI